MIDTSAPPSDRAGISQTLVARAMFAVALAGVIVAIAGCIVGWRLAGNIRDATGDSLDVTIDSLDTVENTVDLSEEVLLALDQTVETTESTLTATSESIRAGSSVIGEVTELTETVGPSLDEVARTLRRLETVGTTIDGLLVGLSDIPFAPSYDPDEQLGETIGTLAEEVSLLPAQFESTSTDLREFDRSVLDITAQVDELTTAVGDVRSGLDGTQQLIAEYRLGVDEARTIALGTRSNLDTDVRLMRIVLVVGAITLAFAQIVPLWIGSSLLATRRRDHDDVVVDVALGSDSVD